MLAAETVQDYPNLRSGDTEEARQGRTKYAVRQFLQSKEVLMRDILDPETTPAARAQLVRALVAADEQIMARKGIPTPKPAEIQPKGKSKSTPVPRVVD